MGLLLRAGLCLVATAGRAGGRRGLPGDLTGFDVAAGVGTLERAERASRR